jgi:hypothetical protein
MALEPTEPLIGKTAKSLRGGKRQPAPKPLNITAICELSRKCGIHDVSQRYGPPQPLVRVALPIVSKTPDIIVLNVKAIYE